MKNAEIFSKNRLYNKANSKAQIVQREAGLVKKAMFSTLQHDTTCQKAKKKLKLCYVIYPSQNYPNLASKGHTFQSSNLILCNIKITKIINRFCLISLL